MPQQFTTGMRLLMQWHFVRAVPRSCCKRIPWFAVYVGNCRQPRVKILKLNNLKPFINQHETSTDIVVFYVWKNVFQCIFRPLIISCTCQYIDLYAYIHVYTCLVGRSGIKSRWGLDFPPVQTGPGAHPAFCEMGTRSFPGVNCGRGVLLTTHPLIVPRSWKSRAIPLPTLWATPGL